MSDLEARGERGEHDPRKRASEEEEAAAAGYIPPNERRVLPFPVERASGNDKPAPNTLRFIPASEFLTPPTPPVWVIDGMAETDSLTILFGDPESGKSFLAMDWAACVATGHPWKSKPVRKGPVLYVNGEGHNGINRRFTAWCIANNIDLKEHPLYLSTTTTALTDEVARAELEAVIAEFIREHGMPAAIVIDTLARNFGPGDENSTQDMGRAVETLDAIRRMTGAWVIAVHHSGHADKTRARGSIVLRGSADTEYRMTRPEAGDTTLTATKTKDGARPDPITFRFADVELGVKDDHGREVTSAVLIQTQYIPPDDIPASKGGRPAGTGKHLQAAITTLQTLYGRAVANVTKDGRDPDEAKVAIEFWRDACIGAGMHRNRFSESLAQLKAAGRIRCEYGFAYPNEDDE